ncbi:hypothetical protein VPH47_12540 [Stenotrophomonas sp. WED208]|uniref:hypothetical protein n=1 Tax=Stenotrophomonas sp. WED208 TaxID=3112800 RepID=UPI0034D47EE4
MDWMDWKVIISTLVGGLITFAATTGQETLKNRRVRRAAAFSVGAEITAALEIVRAREWREDIESCYEDALNGEVLRVTIHLPKDTIPSCRVALAQGTLGDGELIGHVSAFVMAVDGLKADLDRLFEHDFGDPRCLVEENQPERAAKLYKEMIGLLDAIDSRGNKAIKRAVKLLGRDGSWMSSQAKPKDSEVKPSDP